MLTHFLAFGSSRSKSLASKSKSLASKSASLASKSASLASKSSSLSSRSSSLASVSSALAASLSRSSAEAGKVVTVGNNNQGQNAAAAAASSSAAAAASRAAARSSDALRLSQSRVAASASSLASVASVNSAAAASLLSARASLASAQAALSASIAGATASQGQAVKSLAVAGTQQSAALAAARALLSADNARINSAASSASSVSVALASASSSLSASSSRALASINSANSAASVSLASAQSSLSSANEALSRSIAGATASAGQAAASLAAQAGQNANANAAARSSLSVEQASMTSQMNSISTAAAAAASSSRALAAEASVNSESLKALATISAANAKESASIVSAQASIKDAIAALSVSIDGAAATVSVDLKSVASAKASLSIEADKLSASATEVSNSAAAASASAIALQKEHDDIAAQQKVLANIALDQGKSSDSIVAAQLSIKQAAGSLSVSIDGMLATKTINDNEIAQAKAELQAEKDRITKALADLNAAIAEADRKAKLVADAAAAQAEELRLSSVANADAVKSIADDRASVSQAAAALTVSAANAAASIGINSAAVAEASRSLALDAASLTSVASSLSTASVAVVSSASVLSDRSTSLDGAVSSLSSSIDSVTASFGVASDALAAQSAEMSSISTALAGLSSSLSVVSSDQSVAATQLATSAINAQASATALAGSAADIASQTSVIGSITSSLAAEASASGLATACLLPTYLGNGHCYKECPAAFPNKFERSPTYGLCCTIGAQACVNASPTGATVCQAGFMLTVLDDAKNTGTCTRTCSTTTGSAATNDLVKYEYTQWDSVYPECNRAQDCVNGGTASADPTSLLCCAPGVKSCVNQSPTGATACQASAFFNALTTGTTITGQCDSTCKAPTPITGADNVCQGSCSPASAVYTDGSSKQRCCPDPNATTCGADSLATACKDTHVLNSAGQCVLKADCPNNGIKCCSPGALSCDANLVALSCGTLSGAQTFLSAGACVSTCPGASSLVAGLGRCCNEVGAAACGADGVSTICAPQPRGNFLLPASGNSGPGTCVTACQSPTIYSDGSLSATCLQSCPGNTGSFYSPYLWFLFMDRDYGTDQICCRDPHATQCHWDGSMGYLDVGASISLACESGWVLNGKVCVAKESCSNNGVQCCAGAGVTSCDGTDATVALSCGMDGTTQTFLSGTTCVATCPNPGSVVAGGKGVCCTEASAASCAPNGLSLTCAAGSVFTPSGAADNTGTCTATCATDKFLSAGVCQSACSPETAHYTDGNGLSFCCTDPFATECTATASTKCDTSHVLEAGQCIDPGQCPNNRVSNGQVCCEAGALACTTTGSTTVSTACGLSGQDQTFLSGGACVAVSACAEGHSVLGGNGFCCADAGSVECASEQAGFSTLCASTSVFTPSGRNDGAGTCSSECAAGKVYSAGALPKTCLDVCTPATAHFTDGTKERCCEDDKAKTCSAAAVSTSCIDGFVLSNGVCVADTSCAHGGGECCAPGATACTSATVATECGLNGGVQTYLTLAGQCVAKAACTDSAGTINQAGAVLTGDKGVCCQDVGALTCSTGAIAAALTCDNTNSFFFKPASGATGTCVKYCAGGSLDPATNQCVATCASTTFYTDPSTQQQTCCSAGSATCGPTGQALTCANVFGNRNYLQPDGASCATSCPDGTVQTNNGAFCCAKGSSECTGVAKQGAALACNSDFLMLDKTCVPTCPTGTAANGDNTACVCTGQGVNTCSYQGGATACLVNFHLSGTSGAVGTTCVVDS